MTRKGKRKPPSRVRYEAAHPTVSVRLSRQVRDRIDEIRAREGKSFGDILREAFGPRAQAVNQAYDRGLNDGVRQGEEHGYRRGLEDGQVAAKNKYLVMFRCYICGGWIELSSDDAKAEASQCMEKNRWRHSLCP